MAKHFSSITRKLAPWFAAGMLLQAGGCQFDTNSAAAELLTAIVGSLITDLVNGSFNLI